MERTFEAARRLEEEHELDDHGSPWWVWPILVLFIVFFAVAFVALAALFWALTLGTLGGGCALVWCPFG